MEEIVIPIAVCAMLFLGLPWLVFHYITQWKRSRSLSVEDENLMDELYDLARRLTDRVETVERIVAADNPGFRPGLSRPENTYAALAEDRDRTDELAERRDGSRRSRFDR